MLWRNRRQTSVTRTFYNCGVQNESKVIRRTGKKPHTHSRCRIDVKSTSAQQAHLTTASAHHMNFFFSRILKTVSDVVHLLLLFYFALCVCVCVLCRGGCMLHGWRCISGRQQTAIVECRINCKTRACAAGTWIEDVACAPVHLAYYILTGAFINLGYFS